MFSSHPLFRRFENELIVGEHKLEWTRHHKDFAFRPYGADEEIVWLLLGRAGFGSLLNAKNNIASRNDSRVKIEHVVRGRQFWRLAYLPSGEECFLRKKYGIFRHSNGELVRFDYPSPLANFGDIRNAEIEQFLKFVASESDFEATMRWPTTPRQERIKQLLLLRGGSFDELEALIQGALVLSGERETRFSMRDITMVPGRIELRYKVHWWETHPVYVFFEILNRHFHLERTNEEWRGHDELGDPEDVPYPVFTSSNPTQHELLEAQLSWRDFLRDKLPPEEIAALLKI